MFTHCSWQALLRFPLAVKIPPASPHKHHHFSFSLHLSPATMVCSQEQSQLVYDIRLSSVGPGRVTGSDVVHEPSNMDLAMKLHYLRGVYFFRKEAVQGFNIYSLKEPMFTLFNYYYWTCGRFRRSDSGRPFIKCNDCGARIIEAKCDKTIDEWLDMNDASLNKLLVSNQIIGPELPFSPLVLLQVLVSLHPPTPSILCLIYIRLTIQTL